MMAVPRPSVSTSWRTLVVDLFPVAVASPESTTAVPSESFTASPKLPATLEPEASPESASWSMSASLVEELPTASFPPVFARALPRLVTSLSWLTLTTPALPAVSMLAT